MKSSLKNYWPFRLPTGIAVMAIILLLLPGRAFSQQKEKSRAADKVKLEATLPEATITAKFSAATYEVVPFRVQVELENPSGRRANVSIQNKDRRHLYHENFTSKEYNRIFNFNELIPGAYTFRFVGYKHTESRRFLVEENYFRNIQLEKNKLHVANTFIASFDVNGPSKVNLHLDNLGKEAVRIIVTDENGQVVYQVNNRDKQVLKTFNMALMQDGNYTVTVKNNTDSIQQSFEIKSGMDRKFAWLDKRGKPINSTVTQKAAEASSDFITVRNK